MDVNFKKSIQGFTLIELVLVIMISVILAGYALIKWQGPAVNVYAQAEQLANDLRYAQALSMTKGQRFNFIQLTSSTYQIRNASGTAITLAAGNTTVTLNNGISFGTLTNLPNSVVAFDGEGSPYSTTGSPGTALAATASIPLTSSSYTATVSISPTTGRVIIQ